MGQWMHAWQLSELLVGDDEHAAKTMEYWNDVNNGQITTSYDEDAKVFAKCVYDNYSLVPILQQPRGHHYFSDVATNPIHDCEWPDFLTENDPNRMWVDDEGNVMAAELAPAEATKMLHKKNATK